MSIVTICDLRSQLARAAAGDAADGAALPLPGAGAAPGDEASRLAISALQVRTVVSPAPLPRRALAPPLLVDRRATVQTCIRATSHGITSLLRPLRPPPRFPKYNRLAR
jgi:hypothetical protein